MSPEAALPVWAAAPYPHPLHMCVGSVAFSSSKAPGPTANSSFEVLIFSVTLSGHLNSEPYVTCHGWGNLCGL